MALWGNKDLVTSTGTIAINFDTLTVTGSGTTFSDHGVSAGDVLSVGAGATFGFATVNAVASNTSLTIHSTDYFVSGITTVEAGAAFAISQEPLYAMQDSQFAAPEAKSNMTNVVYGIDQNEVSVASTTAYAVTHGGWVGVTTYVDTHGNLRVKNEVLVATGSIDTTADADDDSVFADS